MTDFTPADRTVRDRSKRLLLELIGLTILAVLAGYVIVPACWTSNALNPGFTGWCIGLAKHLEGGHRLYLDDSHVPLSPLPFVLLHWISPAEKTWLLESVVHFVCVTLTLLIMHVVISRIFRPPIPLVTSLLSASLFFTNEITLLYNSMPQVFVALGCCFCVCLRKQSYGQAVLLGLTSSLCLLTKQTPGTGLVAGVILYYAATRGSGKGALRFTLSKLALYLTVTFVTAGLGILLLSAYLSPSGFVHDVLLTGSEPKGGPGYLASCFMTAGARTAYGLLFFAFLAVVVGGWRMGRSERVTSSSPVNGAPSWRSFALLIALVAAILALYALVAGAGSARSELLASAIRFAVSRLASVELILQLGYLVLVGLVAWSLLSRAPCPFLRQVGAAESGAFAVAIFACAFHSLSVRDMNTWYTDQAFQPMVVFSLGVIIQLLSEGFQRLEAAQRNQVRLRLALSCSVAAWLCTIPLQRGYQLIDLLRGCRSRWPNVSYLAGAKMKETAEGLHRVVEEVKAACPPDGDLLVLPGDPNLEAMIDRRRTALSCLIVFTDQYWQRYVEEDVRRLKSHPPAVIVIGPVNFMKVAPQWSPAASQFIERVRQDILPEYYVLRSALPVIHRGVEDHFEVYLLK